MASIVVLQSAYNALTDRSPALQLNQLINPQLPGDSGCLEMSDGHITANFHLDLMNSKIEMVPMLEEMMDFLPRKSLLVGMKRELIHAEEMMEGRKRRKEGPAR